MIYADNAATTKISELAFKKMLPFLREQYGNASSQYSLGVKARRAIEQSRRQVSSAIGAKTEEIAFTSGGSESNSWVLYGLLRLHEREPVHVITSVIEHHSVLNACHDLESKGVVVTYLPVDSSGQVHVENLLAEIRPNTKLVSIMLANNEIGSLQPIAEIGRQLKGRRILFHTDAVQAIGHIPVNVEGLGVDLLTASAHKFNGAKGTGFLYIRSGERLPRLVFGGAQEHGIRGGTENVAGIVALGYSLEESIAEMSNFSVQLKAMVAETISRIKKRIPDLRVNGSYENRLPGTINLGFNSVLGEALMHILDLKGICVSTSSACMSGRDVPSHVLLALGQTEEQAKSAIRISYGRYNTKGDAIAVAEAICMAHEKITMSHCQKK
jgi:cysteine desulfurase